MKRITVALCALALLSSAAFAQKADKDKAKSKDKDKALVSVSNKQTSPMPDSAAMMQNWMAYMTPGKAHEMMAKTDGTWDGDITMWMEPGGQPMKSTGTAVNKMILGGRYQHSVHTGSFMGQPFEGINTLAYDNAKKVYITTWIDNMGTGIMQAEGAWDPAIKGIVFKGIMFGPERQWEANAKDEDGNTGDDLVGAGFNIWCSAKGKNYQVGDQPGCNAQE